MKVFISWSGSLSKEIAESINSWLPAVLQAVKPYFTPDDIEKGARWNLEIAKELESSKLGIFCITRENVTNPWLVFEAGAISRTVGKGSVCPILFDVDSSDISGPLNQFQFTQFIQDDFLKLIQTINNGIGNNKLPDSTLLDVFNKWWPELEEKITKIIASHAEKKEHTTEIRTDRDIIEEILGIARMMSKSTVLPNLEGDIESCRFALAQILADKSANKHEDIEGNKKILNELIGYVCDKNKE